MVRRYPTEGRSQQGKGTTRKWGVWRKPEAEPMYVANSEPARWCCGGGRADVTRRVSRVIEFSPVVVILKSSVSPAESWLSA